MGSRRALLALLVLSTVGAMSACKKHEMPAELVGSYARSGDVPAQLRAELSVARGGMVLTVVKLSASADTGAFASLFTSAKGATAATGSSAGVSADIGRSVVSARPFEKVACEGSSCTFELAADKTTPACSGSFEKVQNTIIVVAGGPCQPYSGRWVLLDGLPAAATGASAPSAPAPSAVPPPAVPVVSVSIHVEPPPPPSALPLGSDAPVPPKAPSGPAIPLSFPPDVPAPHDHMSCLSACGIVGTRCHRTTQGRDAFLECVEKEQICRAKCEQAWPFFGP